MADEPVIDHAGPADDEALARIVNGVRAADGDEAAGFDHAWTAADARALRTDLEGRNGAILIARLAAEAAAFGTLEPTGPDVASLGVWVLPAFRRKGLGTAVARGVLDLARERGYRRIRGKMLPSETALSFLSSIGALAPAVNPSMEFELPL